VRISYNEMILIYHGVLHIYTCHHSVHLHCLDPSLCPQPASSMKLNGGGGGGGGGGCGGEKQIFLSQLHSRVSGSFHNWHLQVLLRLHSSTVCSQSCHISVYGETEIIICHIRM
jgi:hypothetical protein